MRIRRIRALPVGALLLTACAAPGPTALRSASPSFDAGSQGGPSAAALALSTGPVSPLGEELPAGARLLDLSRPPLATDVDGAILLDRALETPGPRIIVSRGERHLWLMDGERVLFSAPVAVGRDTIFRYGDQVWDFSTPRGARSVRDKEPAPVWVPPDWHYLELAVERGLEPVRLSAGSRVPLSDGTRIEVRGDQVGRVNQYGNFHPFRPGTEIIFDGRIFMPPLGTAQRRVPEVLGTHRLILGDGYLIHGTPDEDSIGQYASHGCVRMRNADVERLYAMVDVGTPVYIY